LNKKDILNNLKINKMSTKQLWLNLPVKDVNQSVEFFTKIGFSLNTHYKSSDHSACLFVGDNQIAIMLFAEAIFKTFTKNEVANTKQGTEILLSIDAESREEVDEIAKKVLGAGGVVYAEPAQSEGWMYGCGFEDLDGHRWNVLYMDMTAIPPS
jgi:predicted lactoylglutathione lyase